MADILTVEDSVALRSLIRGVLEGEGHTVYEAGDGAEGMVFARENSVDLVLSDVNMPNMSGISMVQKLRRLDDYKYIPIIMITTERSDYKKNKARGSGATGWLVKPFTPEDLLRVVNKVLSKDSVSTQP